MQKNIPEYNKIENIEMVFCEEDDKNRFMNRISVRDLSYKKFEVIAIVDIITKRNELIAKRRVKYIYYKDSEINKSMNYFFYPVKTQGIMLKLSNKYGKKMKNINYTTIELKVLNTRIYLPVYYIISLSTIELRKIKLKKLL